MHAVTLILSVFLGRAGSLPALEVPPGQQGDPAYESQLRQHLQSAPGQFTDDQIGRLSSLIVGESAKYPDPAFQAKLKGDAMDYVLSRATSDAFVSTNPFAPEGTKVDVFRNDTAMELFEYELQFRFGQAGANQKSAQTKSACAEQIDALGVTLGGRLPDLLAGPGAQQYVENTVERFKNYLKYFAESDLEFVFRTPLAPDQLRDLQLKLATYSPPQSEIPQTGRDAKQDQTKIWVSDPEKPTFHMSQVTDFGLIALAENHLSQIYTPKGLYGERYRALRTRMLEQYSELRKTLASSNKVVLGNDPGEGWFVSRFSNKKASGPSSPPGASPESARSVPRREPERPPAPALPGNVVSFFAVSGLVLILLAAVIVKARMKSKKPPGTSAGGQR